MLMNNLFALCSTDYDMILIILRLLVKKRASDILRREANELKCAEEKLRKQHNLITTSLIAVGSDDLPPGLELPSDIGNSSENVKSHAVICSILR